MWRSICSKSQSGCFYCVCAIARHHASFANRLHHHPPFRQGQRSQKEDRVHLELVPATGMGEKTGGGGDGKAVCVVGRCRYSTLCQVCGIGRMLRHSPLAKTFSANSETNQARHPSRTVMKGQEPSSHTAPVDADFRKLNLDRLTACFFGGRNSFQSCVVCSVRVRFF